MVKSSSAVSNTKYLRDQILVLAEKNGFGEPHYKTILDYTINNLQSNGLGEEYLSLIHI